MVRAVKNRLYFLVAGYFWFFAHIRLAAWKPRIVVITGSNGKTSTLKLVESQLGNAARYSHNANSSFGIPFDILGLKRTTYSPLEWVWLIVYAPLCAWKKPYTEKIYVVEADCDRPGEGHFLSSLLEPEVVIWLSSARTHSQNFERKLRRGTASSIEETIAEEFGYFVARATKLVMINADNLLITKQIHRASAEVYEIRERECLEYYTVTSIGTTFTLNGITYGFPFLLPREMIYAVAASLKIAEYFGIRPNDFFGFTMPPGRSSLFKGMKNTTIVDSSYNANVDSVAAVLHMIKQLPSEKKWAIIGDLTEQGTFEKEEHEKIAQLLNGSDFQKIILVGPRLARYTLPILKQSSVKGVVSFVAPREALDYIKSSLIGGEMLVFKGARFLEGVIEHLLQNKEDATKLCRRERVWQLRRQKWGL